MFEQCLYFNSNALARTVSRIWSEAFRRFGLSPPHAFLLRVVLDRPGLCPSELAEELSLSRSTITRFLDSLEKRNFLVRTPTDSDGRELRIYPTHAAKEIHRDLDETGERLSRLMAETLGKDDLLTTVSKLRAIKTKIDEM